MGRPRIEVDMEDVRSLRFSWLKIADILGISRSTLYRRLEEEGITMDMWYTPVSDNDLDRTLFHIKEQHPHDGERLLRGHLISMGI